jgi:hypothetical protein
VRRFKATGYRDYRVPYEVEIEADCEDDVTDERVGVAIAEATGAQPGRSLENWEDADIVGEMLESVVEVEDDGREEGGR